MPEGPSVRRFHHLVTPFVGQQVVRTDGSSKKLHPSDFQSLWLQDTQVHGKKLFLRFDPDEEIIRPGSSSPQEPPQKSARKEEFRDQKEDLGPHDQEISSTFPGSPEYLVPSGDSSGSCVRNKAPAACAEKWLQLSFGMFGSIWVNKFSRAKKANKRGDWRDPIPRLVLYFSGGGFLVFYNCQMSWGSGPVVRPTSDILSEQFHRGQALEALSQPQPVCYTLLDQRYFSGLGNIIKNEALFRAGIHPLSLGSMLSPLHLEVLLDQVLDFSAHWLQGKLQGQPQRTQIYQKESCPAGHRVLKEALGPAGGLERLTWWCPQCQPQEPSEESPNSASKQLQVSGPSAQGPGTE